MTALNHRYRRLCDDHKRILRSKYISYFKVGEAMFYRALKNPNLSSEQLAFFARMFNVDMEDLIAIPLNIRPIEVEEKESIEEIAASLGLEKMA